MIKLLWAEMREIDTGRKMLRSFGLLVGSVLILVGLVVFWMNDWTASTVVIWLAGIGAALAVSGLLLPSLLKVPYRVWMGLVVVLGFIMTRVILTSVFYLVITPTGLLLRLFGKDPLRRAWDREASTYWIDKQVDDDSVKRLERYY